MSYGVHGRSASGDGIGVFGENTGTMFNAYGVHGSSASPVGSAVFGDALATTGPSLGVLGVSSSTAGTGVKGVASGFTGTNYGVWGQSASPAGRGVYGWAVSASGWAGYFSGNVQVTGTITKGGGSFKIDHPLDPENKYLYHSFVESPDMMNRPISDGCPVSFFACFGERLWVVSICLRDQQPAFHFDTHGGVEAKYKLRLLIFTLYVL